MKYLFAAIPSILIALAVLLGIRPINKPTLENCYPVNGVVEKVYSNCDGCYDITIKIQGDANRYYINRGEERGLDIETLSKQIVGEEVEIKMVKHWTVLEPSSQGRHIAQVTHRETILYSEITE